MKTKEKHGVSGREGNLDYSRKKTYKSQRGTDGKNSLTFGQEKGAKNLLVKRGLGKEGEARMAD